MCVRTRITWWCYKVEDLMKLSRLKSISSGSLLVDLGKKYTNRECRLKKSRIWAEIDLDFKLLVFIQKKTIHTRRHILETPFVCLSLSQGLGETLRSRLNQTFFSWLPARSIYAFAKEVHFLVTYRGWEVTRLLSFKKIGGKQFSTMSWSCS